MQKFWSGFISGVILAALVGGGVGLAVHRNLTGELSEAQADLDAALREQRAAERSSRELRTRLERTSDALQRSEKRAAEVERRLREGEERIESVAGNIGDAQEAAAENRGLIIELGAILEGAAPEDVD